MKLISTDDLVLKIEDYNFSLFYFFYGFTAQVFPNRFKGIKLNIFKEIQVIPV